MKKEDSNKRKAMYNLINQWEDSGITKKEFCTQEGITYESFRYWSKKQKEEQASLVKESKPENTNEFIPLTIKNQSEKKEQPEIIYPNGVKIRLGSSVLDTEQLRPLIHLY